MVIAPLYCLLPFREAAAFRFDFVGLSYQETAKSGSHHDREGCRDRNHTAIW